jgi:secondary thiamine-phosphate synthase enzyme
MEAAGKAVAHEGLSGEAGMADEALADKTVVHEASIDEKAMVEAVMGVGSSPWSMPISPLVFSFGAAATHCAPGELAMKSYRKELWFETPGRRAFLNITLQVEAALKESGVQEGLALVNAMHITASVFINDDERGLHADYEAWLERLAPHEPVSGYRHNQTGEDNADAHMKRQIMGREVVVAITAGKLDFGPWEQIFYGEFDGGRRKRALIKIIGD